MEAIEEMIGEMPEGMDAERFVIDTDDKADWAIRKIRAAQSERDRRLQVCRSAIASYQQTMTKVSEEASREINYFTALLSTYFAGVEHKETKTQETYWLPSGRLMLKKASEKIVPCDTALMDLYPDYIEDKPQLRWGELKKRLSIVDGAVIDRESGEVLPQEAASVETKPAVFSVEV